MYIYIIMFFYIFIILIIILIFIPDGRNKESLVLNTIKKDILAKTDHLTKYLVL
jgi:hypothetical protein